MSFVPHIVILRKDLGRHFPKEKLSGEKLAEFAQYPVIDIDYDRFVEPTIPEFKPTPDQRLVMDEEEIEAEEDKLRRENDNTLIVVNFLLVNPKNGRYMWADSTQVKFHSFLGEKQNERLVEMGAKSVPLKKKKGGKKKV